MTQPGTPLILVEDDDSLREATAQALTIEGFAVQQFADAGSALRAFEADYPGVVITDVRLPGMDGLELFDRLRELDEDTQVIVTTGHGDVPMAVAAMKLGAADFLTKPFAVSELVRAVRRAAERRALTIENRKLRVALRRQGETRFVGSSKHAERLRRTLAEVARADVDLVIEGAPGTGKTFAAELVHDLGPRQGRPFVTIDPGVLAHEDAELLLFGRDPSVGLSRSGLIERAQGGTLLFDGIEALPEALRPRVFSVLDSRRFLAIGADRPRAIDVRVIAVVHDEPNAQPTAADGRSLLHRLGGISISLPTLVERREDIPELFRHFVRRYEAELGTTADDLGEPEWRHLLGHDWPGNVRELSSFARNFVLGLTRIHQPGAGPQEAGTLRELLAGFERAVLSDALRQARGRTAAVQQALGIPRKTLYDKLSKHGLKPGDYRR